MMEIKGTKVVLRPAEEKDAQRIFEIQNTEYVKKYNLYGEVTLQKVLEHIRCTDCYVIEYAPEQKVIGQITVQDDAFRYHISSKELAFFLDESYSGKHLMKEALTLMIQELLKDNEIVSGYVFKGNEASEHLMGALGFRCDGTLQHAVRNGNNQVYDLLMYSYKK